METGKFGRDCFRNVFLEPIFWNGRPQVVCPKDFNRTVTRVGTCSPEGSSEGPTLKLLLNGLPLSYA